MELDATWAGLIPIEIKIRTPNSLNNPAYIYMQIHKALFVENHGESKSRWTKTTHLTFCGSPP